MEDIQTSRSETSLFQRRLSLGLLGLLCLIAASVLWIQGYYDPAQWRERTNPPSSEASQAGSESFEGLSPFSAPEQYDAETLSNKINGKADLYLSAGFQSLESRRFAMASDSTRWLERFIYRMNGYRNAYAVYSAQRRKDIRKIDLTPQAYLSANGLFMVHGPYYVEIIASEASDVLQSHMQDVASAFVRSRTVQAGDLPELDLFIPDDLVPHTTRLIADSAFGIQSLDWIFTSNYAAGQAEATAFISKRASGDDARAAAKAFMAYWNEYGAEAVQPPENLKGVQIAFILDAYEIILARENYIFGVHEATQLEFGLALVERLNRSVGEIEP